MTNIPIPEAKRAEIYCEYMKTGATLSKISKKHNVSICSVSAIISENMGILEKFDTAKKERTMVYDDRYKFSELNVGDEKVIPYVDHLTPKMSQSRMLIQAQVYAFKENAEFKITTTQKFNGVLIKRIR